MGRWLLLGIVLLVTACSPLARPAVPSTTIVRVTAVPETASVPTVRRAVTDTPVAGIVPSPAAATGAVSSRTGSATVSAATQSSRLLYVASEPADIQTNSPAAGQVSLVDPTTGRTIADFPSGVGADVAVTPDGSLLYIASVDPSSGEDHLVAIDPNQRSTLWTAVLEDRVKYIFNDGPGTLAVSPDGRRLYIHSYSTTPAGPGARPVSDWLQVVDARTGEIRPDTIPLPDCGIGQLDVARPSATLIVTCFGSGDVRLVDLVTNRVWGRSQSFTPPIWRADPRLSSGRRSRPRGRGWTWSPTPRHPARRSTLRSLTWPIAQSPAGLA